MEFYGSVAPLSRSRVEAFRGAAAIGSSDGSVSSLSLSSARECVGSEVRLRLVVHFTSCSARAIVPSEWYESLDPDAPRHRECTSCSARAVL